ncbi:MAG: MFS transporter, partial [Actinomycetota bacterium]
MPAADRLTARDLVRTPGVGVLVWCSLTGFGGFALLLSSLPLWAATGEASEATAGLATTTATLVATVATQFAVPALVARAGVGPALAAGLLALGAPAPLYALTADPLALAAVSAVRGVGFGLLTVIGSLLVALLAPQGAYGRTAGLYGVAVAVPNLLAVPGAVYLAENVSFALVFWLGALPVLGVPAALRYRTLGRRTDATARAWQPATARASLSPTAVLVAVTLA